MLPRRSLAARALLFAFDFKCVIILLSLSNALRRCRSIDGIQREREREEENPYDHQLKRY